MLSPRAVCLISGLILKVLHKSESSLLSRSGKSEMAKEKVSSIGFNLNLRASSL